MYSDLAQSLKKIKQPPITPLTLPYKPRDAAVLLLLFKEGVDHHVLLTKRSEKVEHHKGQICFPGGVFDHSDANLWETAVRETHEEIGVEPSLIQFVGELGKLTTPSGFLVTPFVGCLKSPPTWTPSPDEIDEVFCVPINHLLAPSNLEISTKIYDGIEYPDPIFTYKDHKIWGATGRILVQFLEVWRSVGHNISPQGQD